MATLAVLRSFTPLLRPSALPLRSILCTSVRHASKTTKVASKATPTAKLPVSIIARKGVKSSSILDLSSAEHEAILKSLKKVPKVAARKAEVTARPSPFNNTSYIDSSALQPSSALKTVSESKTTTHFPTLSERTSFRDPYTPEPDFAFGSHRTYKEGRKKRDAAQRNVSPISARPPMYSALARTYSRAATPTAQRYNPPFIHQYFCHGPACHARPYTSSALTSPSDAVKPFELGAVAVLGLVAATLGAALSTVYWMDYKLTRKVDGPITHESQRLV